MLKEADQKIILAIKEENKFKALMALAVMEIARYKTGVAIKQLGDLAVKISNILTKRIGYISRLRHHAEEFQRFDSKLQHKAYLNSCHYLLKHSPTKTNSEYWISTIIEKKLWTVQKSPCHVYILCFFGCVCLKTGVRTVTIMPQFGLPDHNRLCLGRTNQMGQHNRIGNICLLVAYLNRSPIWQTLDIFSMVVSLSRNWH